EEGEDLAAPDVEIDAAHRFDVAVAFRQSLDADDCLVHVLEATQRPSRRHRSHGRNRVHPRGEIDLHLGGDDGGAGRAYAFRVRRQRMLDAMVPLGWAVLALVWIAGSRAHPHPGLAGEHLGVLLALIGFSAGVIGVMLLPRRSAAAQVPSFAVLILSSATLV